MFTLNRCRQPQMAASLSRHFVPENAERIREVVARKIARQFHAAISRGNNLFTNEVKSDNTRPLSLVKMATNSVTDIIVKRCEVVSLR